MKEFYLSTLLANNVLIKIGSRSPATLIRQCLLNEIAKVQLLKTTYKDVSNNNLDFIGQTNSKIRDPTAELPPSLTKAITTPLKRLDRMLLRMHVEKTSKEQ